MNYEEAVAYIEETPKFTTKNKLEHTKECLRRLGNPQEKFRVIHVAGTNGKGSTCAFLTSILREAGYSCGLFTSPHLVEINERFQINEENIDDVIAPLKDEIYNTFKSYYKAKYNKDIENDLIMMNYLNEEELLNKIKKEYNLNDDYEIVFVRNKYYLNTVLNESLENELMIVLNKKYIVPEELTNIFINDSNRLVENKLVK